VARALDENYSFALDASAVLTAIVRDARTPGGGFSVFVNLIGPNQLLRIEVSDKGERKIVHGPIVEALLGVDVRRIRECAICCDFFWAGRIDQPCCSKKCAHVVRTRRWREKYLEQYKLQRFERAIAAERRSLSCSPQRKTSNAKPVRVSKHVGQI